MHEDLTEQEQKICEENGYYQARRVSGELCALHQFFTTVGLVVGIYAHGYQRRYCYKEYADAVSALRAWNGEGHPTGPWLKAKGRYAGMYLDHSPEQLGVLTKDEE